MRTAVLGLSLAVALVAASPAAACLGPTPPLWDQIHRPGGPAMIIGRVTAVSVASQPQREANFDIWDATATVKRLRAVQGSPRARYKVIGPDRYRWIGPAAQFCRPLLTLKPGDLVLGYELPDGTLHLLPIAGNTPPDLKRLFESYQ